MPDTKNLTTTHRIDHPINIYFIEKFLRRAMPRMPHSQFGQVTSMPAHAGDTAKWRRYVNPTPQTTPLIEGEDPTPVFQEKVDISAVVREYGAYLKTSSWLDLTGTSKDAAQKTDWLADQFRYTIDRLCREKLAACQSFTTLTSISKTDIDTVVRTLLGNNASTIRGPIQAGVKVGTSPIPESFVGIAHTDMMHVLEGLSGFKHAVNYASTTGLFDGEWGYVAGVRWILSSDAYLTGSTYYLPILGEDAYGTVSIPEGQELLIHLSPEQVGSPLKRFGTYGWLTNYAARILNGSFMHVIRTPAVAG